MKIENIEQISSSELSNNIKSLVKEIIDKINEKGWKVDHKVLKDIIHYSVLGIGKPICICDGEIYLEKDSFKIELLVDYRVTYGYKPYQKMDYPLHLFYTINKSVIRDLKIDGLIRK